MGMKTKNRGADNWVHQSSNKHFRGTAQEVLEAAKKQEAEGLFKYVKVSDHPRTFKRIKVK